MEVESGNVYFDERPAEVLAPSVTVLRVVSQTVADIQDTLQRFPDIQDLQQALRQLESFGINIEPLRSRLNIRPDRNILEVYDHIHEYVRALLRALEVIENRCPLLRGVLHTDAEMNAAALAFARKLLKDKVSLDESMKVALQDFDGWMQDVRDFAEIALYE